MTETDYYSLLQSAISRTQPDSFEARVAVYDCLWRLVVEQLRASPNTSEEEVAIERATFLRAVQRIEFGSGPPEPEVSDPALREQAGAYDYTEPDEPVGLRRSEQSARVRVRKPGQRVFRRIATAMVSACIVLLVAGVAYALIAIRSDPTVAERWVDQSEVNSWQSRMVRVVVSLNNLIDQRPGATTTTTTTTTPVPGQRAVLYEESTTTSTGTTFSGQASWRHQSKSKTVSTAVLSIDVEIPQKNLILEITMQRAPEGSVASHLVEFQFFGPNRSPSDLVENVLGILMKHDELSRGIELKGQIVRVQRGMFLMGLSGTAADVAANMMLLKERGWIDIPIVFNGGARSILAIEKGSAGQNALNEALEMWGQG